MAKKNLKLAVAMALSVAGTAAWAQTITIPVRPAYQYPGTSPASGAASVQVAGSPLFFTPYLGLAIGHDDNLFLTNTNERDSALYIVSPGFKLDARDHSKVFTIAYQAQIGRYADSEDDNYVDHTLRTTLDMAFSPRAYARFNYDYLRAHDPRGSTDRPIAGEPDRYRISAPGVTFAFGAPGADGRVEVYASDTTKRYLNNQSTTFASDRDTIEFGGAFYWRVMPRTYAVVDARRTDHNYKAVDSPFSSTERRVFGGVAWEATAATTGTVKVGRLEKRFDHGAPEFSGTAWEGLVTWAPRTYSRFDFYTGRYPTESSGLGTFILSEATGVLWNHSWTSYLNTEINARYQKDEYQGFPRTDDIVSVGLRAGYRFRRWLTLGAEYTHTQRDSNSSIYEYDRNLYLLTATLSM